MPPSPIVHMKHTASPAIHLFGTIHISKGPAVTLHPNAQKAFDASSHFYAEIPMDPTSQMATMPLMMRKDGKTLDEAIGKDLAAGFDDELKLINPALDVQPFQTMSTSFAAVLPQMLPHQLAGGKPLDLMLWDQANLEGYRLRQGARQSRIGRAPMGYSRFECHDVYLANASFVLMRRRANEMIQTNTSKGSLCILYLSRRSSGVSS
jgi:hypothetical protein